MPVGNAEDGSTALNRTLQAPGWTTRASSKRNAIRLPFDRHLEGLQLHKSRQSVRQGLCFARPSIRRIRRLRMVYSPNEKVVFLRLSTWVVCHGEGLELFEQAAETLSRRRPGVATWTILLVSASCMAAFLTPLSTRANALGLTPNHRRHRRSVHGGCERSVACHLL